MMKIPFFTSANQDARYGSRIREKIDQIIKSGVFILGEEVNIFENNIKNYINTKHAFGVANGSDALHLILMVLNLPKDSEVITTPFTFFASTSCIVRNNLKPVFVDVDYDTYNIDVSKLEAAVTKSTSAILPVDLFSHTPDYDIINNIADKYKLKVIEDSAEAFGMKWKGRNAGLLGDAGVFSFFPTKTLGCFGDGGMIVTDDDEIAGKVRYLRVHGAVKKYHHEFVGINSRLDALQAGILNVKLDYINDEIIERDKIVKIYMDRLKDIDSIKLPGIIEDSIPVWYVFSIRCRDRDKLKTYLTENGIGTVIYYPVPMHLQECFKCLNYKKGDFPIAERLCEESLALPVFIGMKENEVNYICDKIVEFYK